MDFDKIKYYEDKVILIGTRNFSLKQTFECGQCFRWEKRDNGNYIGVAYGRVIELEQNDDTITIYNTNEQDFKNIWYEYFDLERDYSSIKEELSKDELLEKAVKFGYGIRILKQEKFEILLSFIISARNSIPSISKTVRNISLTFGKEIEYKGEKYYTFPTPKMLKEATLLDIQNTGASFRSKYIIDTIKNVYECECMKNDCKDNYLYDLDWIASLDDDECHKELQRFKGVGAKVSDCIMLFSMNKYSAFPVDVWVKRAMEHFYLAPDVSLNKIRIFGRDKFKELSGFAQQYLFYYARENNIKI